MTTAQLLDKLEIKRGAYNELREYLKDSMNIIKKNKIAPLEINLQSGLYPVLAEKYDISKASIKRKFITSLKIFNEENPDVIKSYFGVDFKITLKRLLILMQLEMNK